MGHVEVSNPDQMNFHTSLQMTASNVSIKSDAAIALWILVGNIWMGDVFVSVDQNVWMCIPPNQRSILKIREEEERGRQSEC
mmetsp:Transcript_10405/g.25166  ORF Transcript_10405/g.25166 Transcript_10405/m.25166 type:complete len:82 (-) Transcript_10405:114-359(-)